MTDGSSRLVDMLIGGTTAVAVVVSTLLFFGFLPPDAAQPWIGFTQRLGLTLLFAVAAYGSVRFLRAPAKRRHLTSWWDPAPARADAPLSWDQALKLVSGRVDCDPLEHRPEIRPWPLHQWLTGYVMVLIGLLLATSLPFALILGADGSHRGGPSIQPHDYLARGAIDTAGNFTAYLALVASLITAVFAYHQLRARVRADNRQRWIARARRLLGEVTALLAAHEQEKNRRRQDSLWLRSDPLRLELELMLNPSEKDHRLLLYLIQRLAFLRWKESGASYDDLQDRIQDAVNVRLSILRATQRAVPGIPLDRHSGAGPNQPDLGAWNDILYCNDAVDLISYILRLSHVVLKREWERVKHTR